MARSSAGDNAEDLANNRRTHDRAVVRVPMAAVFDGRPIQIEAANISEGGAYCLSDNLFPVMTRLGVNLEFPPTNGWNDSGTVSLEAVVVRCDPHPLRDGHFNLALYFPCLEDATRARIASFVRSRRQAEDQYAGSRVPADG